MRESSLCIFMRCRCRRCYPTNIIIVPLLCILDISNKPFPQTQARKTKCISGSQYRVLLSQSGSSHFLLSLLAPELINFPLKTNTKQQQLLKGEGNRRREELQHKYNTSNQITQFEVYFAICIRIVRFSISYSICISLMLYVLEQLDARFLILYNISMPLFFSSLLYFYLLFFWITSFFYYASPSPLFLFDFILTNIPTLTVLEKVES